MRVRLAANYAIDKQVINEAETLGLKITSLYCDGYHQTIHCLGALSLIQHH
jgi:hypothetical protein